MSAPPVCGEEPAAPSPFTAARRGLQDPGKLRHTLAAAGLAPDIAAVAYTPHVA